MKLRHNVFRATLVAALSAGLCAHGATLPADWQREQTFQVTAAGLVKLSLSVETLDSARPGLEDLRLFDEIGHEVPYLIERPVPAQKIVREARTFRVSLNTDSTVITLETGLEQPMDGVTLTSPATSFIKSVQVEGSADGQNWRVIAQGQPIFRQPNGASQMRIPIPAATERWLRLTVGDHRSQPVPFTGAQVSAAAAEPVVTDSFTVVIVERVENPGETRLTLNLGAANLTVASVVLETTEPLFSRSVQVAAPQVVEDGIREQNIAQGFIYRVEVEGQPVSSNVTLAVEQSIGARELLLLIRNGDSPPLPVSGVRVERRPVFLVFNTRQTGAYHLLTGNSRCPAPHYDLAGLAMNLKAVPVMVLKLMPPVPNPSFQTPEALSGVELVGADLDVSDWRFRKPVTISQAGAQKFELDLDVLSHAASGWQDLRLVRDGKQIPYIVERTSISRALTPVVTVTNDAKTPGISRWIIRLPRSGLPLTRLSCDTRSALFQRDVTLYEELTDERGEKYRRPLGQTTWVQTPARVGKIFALALDASMQSDTMILETQNGDNPAIELAQFQVFYSVTRVLFKPKPGGALSLYYGNAQAPSPRYDLSLLAGPLLAANKSVAMLGAEEPLKKAPWTETHMDGNSGVIFWSILALVVVVLLVIIARLLPKATPPGA